MKIGFFEIEMVSASEYLEWIKELDDAKCRYVIDHTEPIMYDDVAMYEHISIYGEVPTDYEDCIWPDSAFGFDHLREEFEAKYGV